MIPGADALQSLWPDPLNYAAVRAKAQVGSPWPELFRCVETQCVMQTHNLVLESLARHRKVVLFAVDAIPWRVLSRNARHFGTLVPATSMGPTSSAAVWSSVLRGVPPYVHGLHGVVMYDAKRGCTVSALSNSTFSLDGSVDTTANLDLFLDGRDGLFAEAKRRFGTTSHFLGLVAFTDTATLGRHLAAGTNWHIGDDYQALLETPLRLLSTYRSRILSTLSELSKSTLLYCFLDLDTYFHTHPYSDPLADTFLDGLSKFANELQSRFDACTLFVSDHGMMEQPVDPDAKSVGLDPWIWERSYARPGGAGRVHFFYPRDVHCGAMREYLIDGLEGSGIVLSRDQYLAELAAPHATDVRGRDRIGELVAIATRPDFPSVMRFALQEHGSYTEDEMFVGMGIIGGNRGVSDEDVAN
ncbi:MAG: alkaline phosphatase family protein [Candidatus Hydrogenedentes bacterium]|nr:alkaline phosphatase family protein [Candidatus Hydrogenedentota bacterium]